MHDISASWNLGSQLHEKGLLFYIAMHVHAMTQSYISPQYFSYAVDFVFPRMLHRAIMDMFNVDSEEVYYSVAIFSGLNMFFYRQKLSCT